MITKTGEIKSLSDLHAYVAAQRANINGTVAQMVAQAGDLLRTALVDKCLAAAQSTQYYANMALTQLEAELPNAPRGDEKRQGNFVAQVKGIYLENTDKDAEKLATLAAQLTEYHAKNHAHDAEVIEARLESFDKYYQDCLQRQETVEMMITAGELARAAQNLLTWPLPPDGLFERETPQSPICPRFVPAAEKLTELAGWRTKLLDEKIPETERRGVEINLTKYKFYERVQGLQELFGVLAELQPPNMAAAPGRQAVEALMTDDVLRAKQAAAVKLVAEINDLIELNTDYRRLAAAPVTQETKPLVRPPSPPREY